MGLQENNIQEDIDKLKTKITDYLDMYPEAVNTFNTEGSDEARRYNLRTNMPLYAMDEELKRLQSIRDSE